MADETEREQTPTPPDPTAYGQPISAERQAELQAILDAWDAPGADHGERRAAFDKPVGQPIRVRLTGADVSWLAEQSGRKGDFTVPNLHLEGAIIYEARLEDASLSEAHLERADLHGAHLEKAGLSFAHLEDAFLAGAHLEGAFLRWAHLEGAYIEGAHLEGVSLSEAHLEGAIMYGASLEGADLNRAHLESVNLTGGHLEGADLRGVWLDSKTVLSGAVLDDKTRLGNIQWGGVGAVNLTQINWDTVSQLGDEAAVRRGEDANTNRTYEAAVRAYRQLAAQLRAQGINEVADRFLYRAQVCQRRVFRKRRQFGGYLFSLLLAAMAGYGYRLSRIVVAYVLIVGLFAAGFLISDVTSGQAALSLSSALDALQISLNAIHGRVFFAQFHLDTLQSWIATAESVVGIVVEGIFVAMLIQRVFAR